MLHIDLAWNPALHGPADSLKPKQTTAMIQSVWFSERHRSCFQTPAKDIFVGMVLAQWAISGVWCAIQFYTLALALWFLGLGIGLGLALAFKWVGLGCGFDCVEF